MLGDRRLVAILGLSKGGTNHLAQKVHACDGVAGLTEAASRLVHPTRKPRRQILTPSAFQAGVLRPFKRLEQASVISVNKVNYTLAVYPQAWVKFLAADANTTTILLLRNPLMIHRSRVRFVRGRKPQRTRWLDPRQLAREMAELLAITWRLAEAMIVFHERGLVDDYVPLLTDELGLTNPVESLLKTCPMCGKTPARRSRYDDDPAEWLYCPACERFIEGEGNYNYIRRKDDPDDYQAQEARARNDGTLDVLVESLGRRPVELFLDGAHWTNAGRSALRDALNGDADRWRAVPLDEILYPY